MYAHDAFERPKQSNSIWTRSLDHLQPDAIRSVGHSLGLPTAQMWVSARNAVMCTSMHLCFMSTDYFLVNYQAH